MIFLEPKLLGLVINSGNFRDHESFLSLFKQKMDTKDKILEAATKLFHKFGVRSVTMDDIARELGISKKTIYQYFQDKDEVVTIGFQTHIKAEIKEFTEIVETSKDSLDEFSKISLCLRRNLSDVNPSLLFDLQKYHPRAWALWLDYKNNYIKNFIVATIHRGQAEGNFRANLDAEILARFRVEQVEMTFDENIFPRDDFNFMDVQLALFDHFVHGLLTVKGQELYDNLIDSKLYEKD